MKYLNEIVVESLNASCESKAKTVVESKCVDCCHFAQSKWQKKVRMRIAIETSMWNWTLHAVVRLLLVVSVVGVLCGPLTKCTGGKLL